MRTFSIDSYFLRDDTVVMLDGDDSDSRLFQTAAGGSEAQALARLNLGIRPTFIQAFTATAGQTTFSVAYEVGSVNVFVNGVLLASDDFTATNGTSIVLTTGAAAGDTVTVWRVPTVPVGLPPITVAGATQAAAGQTYHARGTFPVSDPPNPVIDDCYQVRVFGTGSVVTVGGVQFGPGDSVIRRWSGSAWVSNPTFAPIPVARVEVTETVTNSAVLTPSTQLVTPTLLPGVYVFECDAYVTGSATGVAVMVSMSFSGSATQAAPGTIYYSLTGAETASLNDKFIALSGHTQWNGVHGHDASGSCRVFRKFVLSVTSAGTLVNLHSPQVASPGTSANLIRGYIDARRIA